MIQTTLSPNTFRQLFSFSNDDIADIFEQVAALLEAQGNDYYRIRAYRKGADAIRQQQRSVVDIFEAEGTAGLEAISYIGRRLARSIAELVTTGDLTLLARLSIDVSPEDLFTQLPGIGQLFARRIYRGLGIQTLEALEEAAKDGTLAQVPGLGLERVSSVINALEARLSKTPSPDWQSATNKSTKRERRFTYQPDFAPRGKQQPKQLEQQTASAPSVELLLEVDRQYQQLAKAGQLRMITPRRFNLDHKPWLPVMSLKKDGWSFDALYSNTARAHELGKTDDWVVVNYARDSQEGQCTVVTETQGVRRGQRVVRGLAIAAA